MVPPGRGTHGFAYDLGGLDTLSWAPQIDSGDSTPTARRYDLDKRPTVVRLPSGDSLRASYDAAGRLSSVASANDTIGYGYDAVGRLDTLRRGGQSLSYSYDGSLPLSQVWTGAVTGAVSNTWDADFRPSSQTAAGSTVAFAYDADGVLRQAGDLSLSRDATSGLYAGDVLGTLTHALGRNGHGEVMTDTVRNGSAILALAVFTRDSLGRILTKADSVNGTRTNWRYHYDLTGRLDSVWLSGSLSAWYGYDSNGVRTTGTGIVSASVDAQDRVGYSNGITYAYDDNGQLVSRSTLTGTTRYHYTKHGELLSVVTVSGDSVSYTLDPAGRRIARSLNGVVTNRWLWDGTLRPVAEVDANGNLTTRYVYGTHVNVPDYMVRSGTTYRLVTDERGSVRLVVNTSTGDIVSSLSYDVWGSVTSSTNASFQPFGYAGGLRDDATGLTHFGAREYTPELGRWTKKDPIGFNGGLTNLYGYVGNDPVNWVDAWGLISEEYPGYEKTGGSRSWRNNNPGNIISGDWATNHGAIGDDYTGKFAKFPDEESGYSALEDLLSNAYGGMNPICAMKVYAPSSDNNDPDNYAKLLEAFGVDLGTNVGDQVSEMANAIKKVEGWIPGTTTSTSSSINIFQWHLVP